MLPRSFIAAAVSGFSLLALLFSGQEATAERRVALVLGNSAYQVAGLELANPKNDAEDVAAALRRLDFEVVLAADADKEATRRAVEKFAPLAEGADAALFFYAGHALQHQGRNYLLPTDADITDDISLDFAAVPVETIRKLLERSNGVKIMVLDACRNNPVAERLAHLYGPAPAVVAASGQRTRGIERVDKGRGLIIAYAAAPGDIALDGQGRNSPFTRAFLRRLDEPGLEIELMFRRIAADVEAATDGRQRPATYVSMTGDYYLNRNDRHAWEKVATSDDPAVLRDFLERFPSSYYALEARYRLQALDRARAREEQRREQEKAAKDAVARADALRACNADRDKLSAIDPRDEAALDALIAKASCDEVKREATARRDALDARRAREAELCRRQEAEFQDLTRQATLQDLDGLRRRATCPGTLALVERKATELAAARDADCARDRRALGKIGPSDLAALRELAERTPCPQVRTEAGSRAGALEARLRQEAETCDRDEADWRLAADSRDRADLQSLRRRVGCEKVIAAIDTRLAELAVVCRRDGETLRKIGSRDDEALRAFVATDPCAEVKVEAQQRLARLADSVAKEKEACRRDEEAWFAIAASADRSAAENLRRRIECPAIIAAIEAALPKLPAAPKPEPVDTGAQVTAAQKELRRLGCFDGRPTGKLDARTKDSLTRYLDAKGKPASVAELDIDERLVAELKAEDEKLCAPPVVAEPEPQSEPPVTKDKGKTIARLPQKPEKQEVRERPEPKPARQKASRPAPVAQESPRRAATSRPPRYSPAPVSVGSAPAGGGSRGPAVTGVGF